MGTASKVPISFLLPEDLTGTTVGRFAIRSKLGAGGMGDVYYAEDTTLHRPVAIKRVARRLGSDPKARQQILHEAQRASALASEHIASIHDVVEAHGELFLVMEYVEGTTLRQQMQHPVTIERFYQIAVECAEALMAAHEHGIVHCDIKPENIMLTAEGRVKILDFGLAKHLPRSDASSTLGSCAALAGTPAYMAPEILLEKLPDTRADIFSLGIVLYELLTLKHPFSTGSFVSTSERILHETPTAVRVFNPKAPEAIGAVIMKALAKTPTQRYADARELLADLRRAQAGTLFVTPKPGVLNTARRNTMRWGFAVVAALILAAAAAAIYDRMNSPLLKERGWVLISDFETSGSESIPVNGVREGLTIALEQSRYVNVFPRTRAYEVLQRMKKEDALKIDEGVGREICQRENLQVLLAGRIEKMGQMFQITVTALDPAQGNLLFAERERFDRDNQFFEKTDSLAKKIRRKLGESLDRIETSSRPLARVTTSSLAALQLYSRAKDALDKGRDEQIEGLLKNALRLDPDFAMAHLRLGQFYITAVGKNERAVEELERAYLLRQGVTQREQHRIEAGYYSLQERYEDEVQSLSILVSLYPDDEEAHQELASAYYDTGHLDQAITELHEVLRLNPASAPGYRNLVLYLARRNEAEAAIVALKEAQQRGADSPQLHWGAGLAYLGLGDVATARQEFERIGQGTETDRELRDLCLATADLYEGKLQAAQTALTKQVRAVPNSSGGLQTIRRDGLGRILLLHGKQNEASVEATLLLQVPISGLQTYDLLNAGILYARAGRIHEAKQVLGRLDVVRKSVPSSWNRSCFHNLEGEIWLAASTPQQAEQSFAAAVEEYPQTLSHAGLARAYQEQKRWDSAASQWEQVLLGKGEILQDGFPPDLVIAHLQVAQAYREMNKPELARNHYEEVLRMWQHADDIPTLRHAKRELTQLNATSVLQ
jgi:serine/threonine protein kinase/lipoprotein NlpI